jgi:hypothetical protein
MAKFKTNLCCLIIAVMFFVSGCAAYMESIHTGLVDYMMPPMVEATVVIGSLDKDINFLGNESIENIAIAFNASRMQELGELAGKNLPRDNAFFGKKVSFKTVSSDININAGTIGLVEITVKDNGDIDKLFVNVSYLKNKEIDFPLAQVSYEIYNKKEVIYLDKFQGKWEQVQL